MKPNGVALFVDASNFIRNIFPNQIHILSHRAWLTLYIIIVIIIAMFIIVIIAIVRQSNHLIDASDTTIREPSSVQPMARSYQKR